MAPLLRWLAASLCAAAVSYAAYRRRALTPSGALAATGVGAITFARGAWPAAGALLTFFVSSSVLSRFKEAEKSRRGVLAQAKGGQRDAWQVLANGGVAAASLLLAGGHSRGAGAFRGALAAAGADTWATELGLLAPHPPRLITSLEVVPPGTSGGVTPRGFMASLGGALSVGLAWAALDRRGSHPARAVASATLAGLAGSLADSVLGATVQAAYWCPACNAHTESPVHGPCGQAAWLERGWPWMTNDTVNGFATSCGATLGALLG